MNRKVVSTIRFSRAIRIREKDALKLSVFDKNIVIPSYWEYRLNTYGIYIAKQFGMTFDALADKQSPKAK